MPKDSKNQQDIAVIIPAAGIGKRMDSTQPKQFIEVKGIPLFIYTLHAFIAHPSIDEIIIVTASDMLEKITQLCQKYFGEEKRIHFTVGGERRQDSVAAGLAICKSSFVMVHDAARPLVSQKIIDKCCHALREGKSFITAVPVTDTIKKVANNEVVTTLERNTLIRAQTPQGAATSLLKRSFDHLVPLEDMNCTDESSLLEKAGVPVTVIRGEESNFKITHSEDLLLAEPLLKNLSLSFCKKTSLDTHTSLPTTPRIGHGFDAHRLAEDRKLILGGVEIPFNKGLVGHSDADVVTHAVCDALLGATSCGDIGKAFPDSDAAFKNIYSIILLERIIQKISKQWQISNIDITIICQAPKIAPYIEEMREKIAQTCNIGKEQINIKATTEEKMGYTGRGEGISCHTVALLTPQLF